MIAMNVKESVQDLKLKDQSQLEKAKRLKVYQGPASKSIAHCMARPTIPARNFLVPEGLESRPVGPG